MTVLAAFLLPGPIFPILELDRSFEGFMQVSGAPLQQALAQLGDVQGEIGDE